MAMYKVAKELWNIQFNSIQWYLYQGMVYQTFTVVNPGCKDSNLINKTTKTYPVTFFKNDLHVDHFHKINIIWHEYTIIPLGKLN